MLGVMAMILVKLGSGGISQLQSFIVVTAVPVSILILPSLWNGLQSARSMAAEQNVQGPTQNDCTAFGLMRIKKARLKFGPVLLSVLKTVGYHMPYGWVMR